MSKSKKSPESYEHKKSKRSNNPTQETEKLLDDDAKRVVQLEPNIREAEAPLLAWQRSKPDIPAKKAGPLYIHEKIDPSVFLEQLEGEKEQRSMKLTLFPDLPDSTQYECYQHSGGWSNRLIHGNSAQIMASLAAKENLRGKVQMVYFDPPYGISFNSNMQIQTNTTNSPKTGVASISPEPEMVRVFRDTYENGIHDYLDGIRENAILARELLAESGSFFLQIGKANVHRLAVVLDEVFGAENRMATITFCKSAASSASTLAEVADYLLWYAKDNDKEKVKFHGLYKHLDNRKAVLDSMVSYAMVEEEDGSARNLTPKERNDPNALDKSLRLLRRVALTSQHPSTTGRSEPFTWEGKEYTPNRNRQWTVDHKGLERLAEKKRLVTAISGGELTWKQYEDEIPGPKFNNIWYSNHTPKDMHYIVETAEKVIERCILMSTDPGDLVLDITCGSGTTPYVAEKWGRRWIATDASRVPIALTRQRILSSIHDWYVLKRSGEGRNLELKYDTSPSEISSSGLDESKDPESGFVYERIPFVSAATLAYDEPPKFTYLVDRPHKKSGVKRIASAFTVESHSPYRTVSPEKYLQEDMSLESQENIIEALRTGGLRLHGGHRYLVQDIEKVSYPGDDHGYLSFLCSIRLEDNEYTELEPVALSILPDDASCSQAWITQAIRRTGVLPEHPKKVLIIAFNFDSDALVDTPTKLGSVSAICLRANRDLMISTLEHTKYDSAFVQIGEPDVEITDVGEDNLTVEVKGFDTFDPQSGNLKSGQVKDIDCWMLDTNYDQTAFMARRIHFPNGASERQLKRYKKALSSIIKEDEWDSMLSAKSSPFRKPATGQIAVRIITTTAVEMTTVKST